MIFDTHAHYHDSRFQSEPSLPPVNELLDTLFSTEISEIIDIGTDIPNSCAAIELAEQYPHMYAAVGMYPGSCPLPYDAREAENILSQLAEMLHHEKVVALGEIGFDFHYDDVPREIQEIWFARQMQLAADRNMPVIIHNREAHGATMDMLCRFPTVRGVLHSYSGSAEMAAALVKMGYLISVSGVVTFKNAQKLIEVVRKIPLEHLLVETDCPYLTPHPYRGKVNHSGYLVHTIAKIAEIKGVTEEEVRTVTRQNAREFFRI